MTITDFRSLQKDCWQVAEDHGWHESVDEHTFVEKLCLVHSELSEALEEFRVGHGYTETYFNEDKPLKPEGIPSELADVIIRVMDLAEIFSIDLLAAVVEKQAFNKTRTYRHGNKKA